VRRVHAHALRAAGQAHPVGGVVSALDEVEGAAHRAHPERAVHVVEYAVRAAAGVGERAVKEKKRWAWPRAVAGKRIHMSACQSEE
jgi:hypothetical protein